MTALAAAVGAAGVATPAANAAQGQGNAPQLVINPGGGAAADASDGLRFTINKAAGATGQDDLEYRGTTQYCCSAGGPMLNVGGTLFGQSGPAYNAVDWTSITPIATTGSTETTPTGGTGSSTAVGSGTAQVRYVAEVGGLSYVVDRTATYTFPNDYVTDSYAFTIPSGNTAPVKFYLGGDAAPGSSDSGYGVMLTRPVRSVISLNTRSQIQFGFREIAGSKPFDGATSQSFSTPYPVVAVGGDIGFVATNSTHDAGLMMQWDLGSTPGTQTAALEQFANRQGTNLKAAFDRSAAQSGDTVDLDVSVENTLLTAATGVGFTLNLPAGLTIAGPTTNTCGGSTSGDVVGSSSITLAAGQVPATDNCVLTVPVRGARADSYALNASDFTGVTGADNTVGTSTLVLAPSPVTTPVPTPSAPASLPGAVLKVHARGTLNPTTRRMPVRASGLAAGEQYAIRIGATTVARGVASATGTVTRRVPVPRQASDHRRRVTVTGSTTARQGSDRAMIIIPKRLYLALGSTAVPTSGQQRVVIGGLGSNESVRVRLGGKRVLTGHANARGRFVVTLPVGAEEGTVKVKVLGEIRQRVATATFQVI